MNAEHDNHNGDRGLEFLQNVLMPGETVQWTGRPVPRYSDGSSRQIFAYGVVMLLFCLGICTFLVAITDENEGWEVIPFYAVLAVFVGLGLYLCCSPLRCYGRMKRTFYAITNQRAIILREEKRGKISQKAYPVADDLIRERRLDANGGGDLVFAYEEASYINNRPIIRSVGFLGLPELHPVEVELYRLAHGSDPAPADQDTAYKSTLSAEEQQYLQSGLLPGEQLRWDGRPVARHLRGTLGAVLFGIAWLGFVSLMTVAIVLSMRADFPQDDAPFTLWGALSFLIPCVLIGIGLVATPFHAARRSKRTFYALTNKRIIVVTPHLKHYTHKTCPLVPGVVSGIQWLRDGKGTLGFRHNGLKLEFREMPDAQDLENLVTRLIDERD